MPCVLSWEKSIFCINDLSNILCRKSGVNEQKGLELNELRIAINYWIMYFVAREFKQNDFVFRQVTLKDSGCSQQKARQRSKLSVSVLIS